MAQMGFDKWCVAAGLPEPRGEYRFHPDRKWRLDWVWLEHCLALEIEGGVWTGGRHTRGRGFLGDIEKYNEAVLAGWRLLRVTPEMINDGTAFDLISRALGVKP